MNLKTGKLPVWVLCLCLSLCSVLSAGTAFAEEKTRLPDETLMRFYQKSLFIGDSQIRNLGNYLRRKRSSNPEWFAGAKCYGEYSLQMKMLGMENPDPDPNAIQLTYKGRSATLTGIAKKEHPRRIFILIGMNDIIYEHIDRADRYIDKIMNLRESYFPETEMYFLALTPVTDQRGERVREEIDAYNAWLEEKCRQCGAAYMDVTAGLKDGEGWLPHKITTDADTHLNSQGFDILTGNLLDYAQSRYEDGLWDPAEETQEEGVAGT